MIRLVLALTVLLLAVVPCEAALKVIGKGANVQLDTSGFPPQMQNAYNIMKVKCVKCHSLEWTIVALNTGIAPISGQPFDRNAIRDYGNKMKRKPDSNMSYQEIKSVVELLNYLLTVASK